jgi:Cu(I)/Ag(I) efflux system membrane protein CusA/SilA
MKDTSPAEEPRGPLARAIAAALENPWAVGVALLLLIAAGLAVAPFPVHLPGLPRAPVAVDALPDTGDNQQIVFCSWPGRSPADIEDQVTYPLTTALLGVPGVRTLRSSSMFGFASIYVIFADRVPFQAARTQLVERLASLPTDLLPEGVEPTLGPPATALGQVFWYTLEGWSVPADGAPARPVGGFDLAELRAVQDWQVRYALAALPGVAEVASIGGFQREFQVDVDAEALRLHGVELEDVLRAVRDANLDVGLRTLELHGADYLLRSVGAVRSAQDLAAAVVRGEGERPLLLGQVAQVTMGPAPREGALDKDGVEAVGGVVVVQHGANPLEVIEAVRRRLAELAPSLPERELADGQRARVTVVPFYDRGQLIAETLGTLEHSLRLQVLVTVAVVLALVGRVRLALLVSVVLPLAVLGCFLAMKVAGVDANVVSLAGIAIAIGTLVDMGLVLADNLWRHAEGATSPRERLAAVRRGATEVGSAVLTAVATTVVGFLPVFAMTGPEGKLFGPLAATKTFALLASILVALLVVPVGALLLLGLRGGASPQRPAGRGRLLLRTVGSGAVLVLLTAYWQPLGPARPFGNLAVALLLLGGPLLFFLWFWRQYEGWLRWCLAHRRTFLCLPLAIVALGSLAWLGSERLLGFLPQAWQQSAPLRALARQFPGLPREFLPALDEGSFLLMPVTMPHASIGEALELLSQTDRRLAALPEVETAVGKIGRVDSALDPAPIAMVETVVQYRPEFRSGPDGQVLYFAFDRERGEFERDDRGELVPDPAGRPFRQWRDSIRDVADLWDELAAAAAVPGLTRVSRLQPIEARRVMLSTGLRARLGVKLLGRDLEPLQRAALEVERVLRAVPGIDPSTVVADREAVRPGLELELDREALARYGLSVRAVQEWLEAAVGGVQLTTAVSGRERVPVRVRLARELRDDLEALQRLRLPAPGGGAVPLSEVATFAYVPGPQAIKSEDTALSSHVLFDLEPGRDLVAVVEAARGALEAARARGEWELPPGTSYRFAGEFEDQQRAAATLRLVLPLSLLVILGLLTLQFRSLLTTLFVASAVLVAWAGGFLLLWLYAQDWFLAVDLGGLDLRQLLRIEPLALSVAVWVGFLALFGIATDDGVVMATYLEQRLRAQPPSTVAELREAVVQAGLRRIGPCLLTTATTVLALVPVVTSSGRGSDVMLPMALPTLGGMMVAQVSVLLVPVLTCAWRERRLKAVERRIR